MSAQFYRNCPDCGERTHINFYCSNCGGDPWMIKADTLIEISNKEKEATKLTGRLKSLRADIEVLKHKLPNDKMRRGETNVNEVKE